MLAPLLCRYDFNVNPLGETIVAPITGVGRAAVALVRLSGPRAWEIGKHVFRQWPDPVVPKVATYGRYVTGDDGLTLPFEEGKSYTGEQSVEFSVHGSPASVRALTEACLAAGCRPAEPGEFTYRAFMNGRIDLSQAEGVRETVDALTDSQLRLANRMRAGALRESVARVSSLVRSVLVAIEASTDFSEEIGDLDVPVAFDKLSKAREQLRKLVSASSRSWVVEGLTVAILGRPNAGKSSLLNAVIGSDRAIVTEVPGTTRDTIEVTCDVQGFPIRFVDTAGIRESEDVAEKLGVERSLEAAETADHVWYVFDQATGWSDDDDAVLASIRRPVTLVGNKSDLAETEFEGVHVSAKSGAGLEALLATLVARFHDLPEVVPNRRHRPLLSEAAMAINDAMESLQSGMPDDLASVHLRAALRRLGEVSGDNAAEDIIEQVFHDFCIGK